MSEEFTATTAGPPEGEFPDRPTRPAAQNRSLDDRAAPSLLPSLADGLTLLDVSSGRGVGPLQALVLDHLLVNDGPAFWVDAEGYATTTMLARMAPSRRLLDRIHVARGFTPAQHYGVARSLRSAVEATAAPPALIVAPAIDAQYRTADVLADAHAETLLGRTLARLRGDARRYDAPVLVTRTAARDADPSPVEQAADHHLRCEQTRMGPRFVGEDFETRLYTVDDGAYYQTTLAYWRQLLAARVEQLGRETTSATARASGDTAGVGTGVTVTGETTALTADPLGDAWHGGR